MKSAIFKGRLRHTRTAPVSHKFDYRVFMMYLDLDELDDVFRGRWFWSTRRPALARFRRDQYSGPASKPLSETIRDKVYEELCFRPQGAVRLLTNLRYFGYGFNPASFYYCYDDAEQLVAVVTEVTNTPWGERLCYVASARGGLQDGMVSHKPTKRLHVSPFMDMDVDYDWHFKEPAERLSVFMAISAEQRRLFDASLQLKRVEITGRSLARVLVSYPIMTLQVIVGIHWQAIRLWLKGCPFIVHPDKKTHRQPL